MTLMLSLTKDDILENSAVPCLYMFFERVKKRRKDGYAIRVVLMSATIDAAELAQFYRESSAVCVITKERFRIMFLYGIVPKR